MKGLAIRNRRLRAFGLVAFALLPLGACSEEDATDRARKAVEQVRRSIPDPDATAIAQNVDAATVKEAQDRLRDLKEYMGEVNGKLDGVTVHAIEAFQRSAGLPDNGILDQRTMQRLREARSTPASGSPSGG